MAAIEAWCGVARWGVRWGLFSHLGLLNTWPAWLAAGIPSLAAMLLAIGMLAWVDRTR